MPDKDDGTVERGGGRPLSIPTPRQYFLADHKKGVARGGGSDYKPASRRDALSAAVGGGGGNLRCSLTSEDDGRDAQAARGSKTDFLVHAKRISQEYALTLCEWLGRKLHDCRFFDRQVNLRV